MTSLLVQSAQENWNPLGRKITDNSRILPKIMNLKGRIENLRERLYADSNETPFLIKAIQERISFMRKGSNVTNLVSERNWGELNNLMEASDTESVILKNKQDIKQDILQSKHQPSIMHYVCMFQPPLSTVKMLATIEEESFSVSNKEGWFPVHVACHYHASREVIQYLVEKNPLALEHVDKVGRTVLHLLFGNYGVNPRTVKTIVTTCPSTATKENDDGLSALELALVEGKVGMKCINIVNEAIMNKALKH